MRISELSGRTGVPVSSIKFYLREGLLPAGERTGPNQARYGDEHIRRLVAIGVLTGDVGLSVDAARSALTGGAGSAGPAADAVVRRLADLSCDGVLSRLDRYAALAEELARLDLECLDEVSGDDVVVATLLGDALVAALRDAARQQPSRRTEAASSRVGSTA